MAKASNNKTLQKHPGIIFHKRKKEGKKIGYRHCYILKKKLDGKSGRMLMDDFGSCRRVLGCRVGRRGDVGSNSAAFEHENHVGHGGPAKRVGGRAEQPDLHS